MANMAEVEITSMPQSVIVYGPPKAGKTELIGQLARHYRLHWFDIENGASTLMKLPLEIRRNIELYQIPDFKEQPTAIQTVLKSFSGVKQRFCATHGKIACSACMRNKEAAWEEVNLGELSPDKDIVVLDSFTQLTSSANAHSTRDLDMEKLSSKPTYDHWRLQGTLLEKFLDFVQNSRFNVVVITHEMGIDQSDGTEKIAPAGGTKNFARNVAKYFGHVIYCDVKNGKHRAASNTTAYNKVLTGSRTGIDIGTDPVEQIVNIFRNAGTTPAPSKSTTPKSRPSVGSKVGTGSKFRK